MGEHGTVTHEPEPCGGVLHDLQERVKELTALHGTARLLQDDTRPVAELLASVVELLPPAWQYPEITCARIVFDGAEHRTQGFEVSSWRQEAGFTTSHGKVGRIEVRYRTAAPEAAEGPFLADERNLIDSLAEMLRSFLERREAARALQRAHDELELRVAERTAELVSVNRALQEEITERARNEERIRSLAAELSRAEEAERRAIASDLHDHIGQALATVKLKLLEIQRSAAFSGYERTLEEMRTLLEATIRSTRTLTVEISPPILYELGLVPALQWLGEQFERKHGLEVEVTNTDAPALDEVVRLVVFKGVREFLVNTAKHASARRVEIAISSSAERVAVVYRDDGVGFDPAALEGSGRRTDTFGLFNVRERCQHLGGRLSVESAPGRGVRLTLDLPVKATPSKEASSAGAYRPRR